MSLKQEIETWVTALGYYDNNEFQDALYAFQPIADTSKILFNCGVIHATLGEHSLAVQYYQRAVQRDQYLAVAYFQEGVSNFLLGDFEEALANFNDTLLYLRGNNYIDYHQLGLKYKLYSCEALFNRGLCYIYLQQTATGMADLTFAAKEKATPDHDVIDEAIRFKAEGYIVFSIPVGLVYRPSEAKVKNVQARNYLGKARLVAATDLNPSSHRRNNSMDNWPTDRPAENVSYAATNLVRANLSSRTRQQSEPPIQRNLFPPTPPPEADKPIQLRPDRTAPTEDTSSASRTPRSKSATRKPANLDLGVAAFEQPPPNRPRLGTRRTASERPAPARLGSNGSNRGNEDFRSVSSKGPLFGTIDDESAVETIRSVPPDQFRSFSRSQSYTRPQVKRQLSIQEDEEPDDNLYNSKRNGPSISSNPIYEIGQRPSQGISVRKMRVKCYVADETRSLMISPKVQFPDFSAQVRQKFGISGLCKIKMMDDEGDMITMGDQEDLDMAIYTAIKDAKRDGSDMGKIEVWVHEL